MTLTQLQVFVKTIDLNSFTLAGQALNMTQSAVSQAIGALETELGVKLLIRDRRRGLMLTDIGQSVLLSMRKILHELDALQQQVSAAKGDEVGTIHIGSFPSASSYLLPTIIRHFQARYPNIRLVVHEGNNGEINRWLTQREIDVGIVNFPVEGMTAIPLFTEHFLLVLHRHHPLSSLNTVSPEDLHDALLILSKGRYEQAIMALFHDRQISPRIAFEISSSSTTLNMIQEELGVAILPELALKNLPPDVIVRPFEPGLLREVSLALPSREDASTAVQRLIVLIEELTQQECWSLFGNTNDNVE